MPYADVVSFKCRDEQEFGSDEVYVLGYNRAGAPGSYVSRSPVYGGMDTNDVVNPDFTAVQFSRDGFASFYLMENDGSELSLDGDDVIGGVSVYYTAEHIGTHTVTLSGSGGLYDLTYKVWA